MKRLKDGAIDLDRLIHSLSAKETRVSMDRLQTERRINNILSLRTLLRALNPGKTDNKRENPELQLIPDVYAVRAALQGCTSGLLQAVGSVSSTLHQLRCRYV